MTVRETAAGRMARTWPELDARELRAILAENSATMTGDPVRHILDQRAIFDRAWDAQEIARVKLCIDAFNDMRDRQVAYSDCAAYWAALP